jgi:hypothetical protein
MYTVVICFKVLHPVVKETNEIHQAGTFTTSIRSFFEYPYRLLL